QTALQNTAQALSMLGVADGGLSSQGDMLQRMKSLATQAAVGSLSESNRAALNVELQGLIAQSDNTVSGTKFNGISLLDGSLYSPNKMETSVKLDADRASGSFTLGSALANSNELYVNGVTLKALNSAGMSAATNRLNFDITAATTVAQQADAIYNTIQNVLNYQGTDATTLDAKDKLSQMTFTYTSGSATIGVTANVAGTVGNGSASGTAFSVGTNNATANSVKVNGQDASSKTVSTSLGIGTGSATTVGTNGGLNGGTFAAGATAYSGTARTIAQGNTTDSILKSLTTTNQGTTGVDASQISNNDDFVGNIISSGKGFETSYVAKNQVNINIKVGDFTYEARNVVTNPTADTKITFASVEPGGGSFSLQLAANKGISNIADQQSADVLSTRLNAALDGVSFYQNRD
ncbi:MAG: hypothetical protein EOP45_19255, partial [Sphingobacteriaceae bacterium]